VELVEVLTGFKFIGEKLSSWMSLETKNIFLVLKKAMDTLQELLQETRTLLLHPCLLPKWRAYYKSRGLTLYEGLMELLENMDTLLKELLRLLSREKTAWKR